MSKCEKTVRRCEVLLCCLEVVTFLGCGKVSNTDSYAVVSGRVLKSTADPTGVSGVVVWVESDPSSDISYLGGDISVTTNPSGEYEAQVFMGYLPVRDRPEEGTGGTFSVDFPQYVGDARVFMIYQDTFLDLGGGFTMQRGSTLEIWDVYLTDFSPMSEDTTSIGDFRTIPGG